MESHVIAPVWHSSLAHWLATASAMPSCIRLIIDASFVHMLYIAVVVVVVVVVVFVLVVSSCCRLRSIYIAI